MGKPFLFVALDGFSDAPERLHTLEKVESFSKVSGNFGYKVNLDSVIDYGLEEMVTSVRDADPDRQIFVDLKMWNGGRTMASVVSHIVDLEVDYVNVYALAGGEIPKAVEAAEGSKTKILGVTVLTHYDEAYCQKHFRRSYSETVKHLGETAVEAGCNGIILPGTALPALQYLQTIKLCPGIRPSWYKDSRHSEEVTPGYAKKWGADILVCGSPIMKGADPITALRKVLAEMVA